MLHFNATAENLQLGDTEPFYNANWVDFELKETIYLHVYCLSAWFTFWKNFEDSSLKFLQTFEAM
jgi:hypothetical protein